MPDGVEAMVAWANLVKAIVATMRDEDVGNDTIMAFLDHVDDANLEVLGGATLQFAMHVTDVCRAMVPSND